MPLHQPLCDRYKKYGTSLCYSQWIPKRRNGRLGLRIDQGCLGKQKADSNVTLNFPPSFPLLRNHFTLIHQLSQAAWFLLFSDLKKDIKMGEGNAWKIKHFISFCETAYQLPFFYSRYLLPDFYKNQELIYNSLERKVEYRHRGRRSQGFCQSMMLYKLMSLSVHCSFICQLSSHCATNISQAKSYPRIVLAFC